MKILITGFEPFGKLKTNSSEKLVTQLLKKNYDFDLVGTILPVSFERAFLNLEKLINLHKPHYVISFGVAINRSVITPERIAINYRESNIPDNDGYKPSGERTLNVAEDGLFSSLPIDKMIEACQAMGIEAKASNTAGTYVCNDLMYKLVKVSRDKGFKAGFIHIPSLESGQTEITFDQLELGIIEMLNTLA